MSDKAGMRPVMRSLLCAGILNPLFAYGNPPPAPEVWQKITPGMTEAAAEQLLGSPLSATVSESVTRKCYTIISEASEVVPAPLGFFLFFKDGKVTQKQDPWGGGISTDGTPSVPVPMYPYQNQKFQHYPRWLDLRWYPSAGDDPIEYLVEHELGSTRSPTKWFSARTHESASPYLAILHSGSQPGRWRVKARNAAGSSEWSAWQTFTFGQ